MNVRSVPSEDWVCFYFDVDYQITSLTTIAIAFLRHSQIHTIINTFRYFDRLLHLSVTCPFAFARSARVPINLALAIAVTADLLNHKRTLPNSLEALATTTTTS